MFEEEECGKFVDLLLSLSQRFFHPNRRYGDFKAEKHRCSNLWDRALQINTYRQ